MKDIFDKEIEVGDKVIIMFGITLDDGVTDKCEKGSLFKVKSFISESGRELVVLSRKGKSVYVLENPKVIKVV